MGCVATQVAQKTLGQDTDPKLWVVRWPSKATAVKFFPTGKYKHESKVVYSRGLGTHHLSPFAALRNVSD